jgi:hypothetical protein
MTFDCSLLTLSPFAVLVDGRKYTYEISDTEHINVMLNTKDVSEYLKISSTGLEARCEFDESSVFARFC